MKNTIFLIIISFLSCYSLVAQQTSAVQNHSLTLPDSVVMDTIDFRDMYDTYTIVRYTSGEDIVQMDVDRKESFTEIDYILWDSNRNGRIDAIGVYNVPDQGYDYYLLEEELDANALLEYEMQIGDIGFPSFYDSSQIPKAEYQPAEHQPALNYYN
ncbi:MAG: hypothetical protein WBA74_06125 [Cyclobacteriaceae bacterium]